MRLYHYCHRCRCCHPGGSAEKAHEESSRFFLAFPSRTNWRELNAARRDGGCRPFVAFAASAFDLLRACRLVGTAALNAGAIQLRTAAFVNRGRQSISISSPPIPETQVWAFFTRFAWPPFNATTTYAKSGVRRRRQSIFISSPSVPKVQVLAFFTRFA